jgi:peptidyl-prolyl cis-trans isomerase SurA
VGQPLRTPTGFHIVKLNDVRGSEAKAIENQVHARHILMKTTELADDATVRQKLNTLRDRILKGEDFAVLAQTSSEDPGSAPQGGDLGWTGPGTFVPEFEHQLETLKDNDISEPFKTQYGWHIVQMLGHRQFDATDDVKRRKAMEAIRASKADEETEIWLRRLRDEAYVEFKS